MDGNATNLPPSAFRSLLNRLNQGRLVVNGFLALYTWGTVEQVEHRVLATQALQC
eukprot:m.48968 g.48968  ORF g.48968 m.48968 type:complete len:55 (-) comp12037_c0_seq1:137-301(-)